MAGHMGRSATDGACMVHDAIGRVHYVPHKRIWQWSVTDHTRRSDHVLWAGKLSGEAATKEEAQRLVEERWRLATGN